MGGTEKQLIYKIVKFNTQKNIVVSRKHLKQNWEQKRSREQGFVHFKTIGYLSQFI